MKTNMEKPVHEENKNDNVSDDEPGNLELEIIDNNDWFNIIKIFYPSIIRLMSILDNVYLVNLDNRKDRLLFMNYKLQELGINYTQFQQYWDPTILGNIIII